MSNVHIVWPCTLLLSLPFLFLLPGGINEVLQVYSVLQPTRGRQLKLIQRWRVPWKQREGMKGRECSEAGEEE